MPEFVEEHTLLCFLLTPEKEAETLEFELGSNGSSPTPLEVEVFGWS
jgi:hypothetical protein